MKKTIAIWAPLRYANYGDDLQAIAFALFLRNLGYSVKLYQLDETFSKMYQIESVKTIDELCKDVNLCIIAGGALLTPFNLPRRLLQKNAIEYENDFKNLLEATKQYSLKFCGISIGGDGKIRNPRCYYSKDRINFFKSDSFINGTVRLEGDIEQMKKFNKIFTYHPDMLFQTSTYFKYDKLKPTKKYRVGINFKKGKYLDKQLLSDIFSYAETHNDIEFHFTTSHLEKIGLHYQYIPEKESENIKIDRYESPKQLLGVLASMDIFITSMLHLGLTGLSVGTPFVSYRGPGKTKSFLKNIGGEWAILNKNITFKELLENFLKFSRKNLYNRYNVDVINRMSIESQKHYVFCKKIAEKYA